MPTKSVTVTCKMRSGGTIGVRFRGCRGARGNSDSLHVVRVHDGVEVAFYPSGDWLMAKTETDDVLDYVAYAKYPKLKD